MSKPDATTFDSPFERHLEILILAMGIGAVIVAAACLFLGPVFINPNQTSLQFLTKFIFLNSTHTLFTFLLLIFNFEFRTLFMDSFRHKKSWVFIGFAAIPAAGLFYVGRKGHLPLDQTFFTIVAVAFMALTPLHGTGQAYGI